MNKQQIIGLLNIGENREIEFKKAKKQLPKSLWSTYSAFANSKGGIIVLGIKENKENNTYTRNMRIPIDEAFKGDKVI